MGQIIAICDCSKEKKKLLLSKVSQLKNDENQQNLMVKKLLFHQIADLFPYKYLGKGLYGSTVQVFVKQDKKVKFAQKIIPQENLKENYILYDKQIVDRIMLDPFLKSKIVKVHAYSISNDKRKMYLIMDLMKRGDLYFHLCRLQKKYGRFYPQKAIKRIALQLLETIQKIHSYNVIFRNLRSQNIFIKQNGTLAVSDFFFAINGNSCHTYYGAAQYAPPQIYTLQKSIRTFNDGILYKNLNQISEGIEERQIRLSPDVRRYKMNTDFKTRSCDLKQDLNYLKFKKMKQAQSLKENTQIGLNKLRHAQNKQESQSNFLRRQDQIVSRKSNKNLTTIINIIRPDRKHLTYVIPEQIYGQNSQVKQDIKLGPGFDKNKSVFHMQNQEQQNQQNQSNTSENGLKQYDQSVDTWMLGVLLYELIFGRTPFQKWKGTWDVLSKTPACPSYDQNLIDLENHIKNKDIQQIWGINLQNSGNASNLEKDFIECLLTREVQNRKSVSQILQHPFLADTDRNSNIQQLIYQQIFEPNVFEKDIKFFMKNKDSGLLASRTILRKMNQQNGYKNRITQKLFQHQKSTYEDS